MGGKVQEESANKSSEWSGEEMEESAMEEKAETTGGEGRVGQALTVTAWGLERSGTYEVPVGVEARGGNTWEVTSEDADAAVAGGCHGAKKRERERVSSWR